MGILDNTFKDNKKNSLIVVDLRVMLFTILPWTKYTDNYKALWAMALNSVMPWIKEPEKGYQFIIVDDQRDKDTGNYWRQDFIVENTPYLPDYKGQRNLSERPQEYFDLREAGVEYVLEKGYPYFCQNKIEADDWAGAICRMKRSGVAQGRNLFLYTVDTDWQQLVDDQHQIIFVYMKNPCPISHLRGEFEIKKYYYDRQGKLINNPKDIVMLKVTDGDVSDNLLPGSPEELITLFSEPPIPYNPFNKGVYNRIIDAMMLENSCVNRNIANQVSLQLHQRKFEFHKNND